MAGAAVAFSDEDLQTPLRRQRVSAVGLPALEGIAEPVERGSPADQRLLERGERLSGIDQQFLIRLFRWMAEGFPVFGWKQGTNHARDMSGARSHLARIEERPQALRPQAVLRAVPAVPAIEARVHHGGRVPVDELEAEGARPRVLEAAEGRVAGGAQDRARAREPRLEKELLAERDRRGLSGDAVRRVGLE